jgi:hypothetical protein
MVDTINELSDLSRKLNEKSNTLNAVITSINQKLGKLNLGVEAWVEYEPIESGDPYYGQNDENERFSKRNILLLGYCKLDDQWALATKRAVSTKIDEENDEITSVSAIRPLLGESREIRAKAMEVIPSLLNEINQLARRVLHNIEEAEKAAQKL